jgi:tetratricopeptide (TPR) repeat protein
LASWCNAGALAADFATVEKLFRTGQYDECARQAEQEIARGQSGEGWWRLKMQAEMARGKDTAAVQTLADARRRFPSNMAMQLTGYELLRSLGRTREASAALAALENQIQNIGRGEYPPAERVAMGRYFLLRQADARDVLDQFFTATTKRDPNFLEAYYAAADLALGKSDYALAAETLQKAPKAAAEDPRFHYLLARAFVNDDRAKAVQSIADALAINPRHVDSLLLRADLHIDGDNYADAETALKQVVEVDPQEPRAWAFRAVLAHLRSDHDAEASARQTALTRWAANPEADHLIGRKLSQDYRFAEGAVYQRKALELDRDYVPAKVQLCQDLLRLGAEEEGWKLADELFAKDGYNVLAYNLVTLRDNLSRYRTLEGDGFIVRMEAREADLYGPRALALLKLARKTLCEKYGVRIDQPVTVEIFPRKQDFAVRTFGLPGAEGFLGVCFGPVITANSPASQGQSPSNWEAVLWHEFCHTVTLHKTRNKMPRWLSEGISVYEELQENPGWGQWLTPPYREMMLGKELTPLSQLSSAFLGPKTPLHLQFAYFESALAVEFLIRRHGFDALKALLDDLGNGLPVNEALTRRTGHPLERLDRDFAEFARERAKSIAPGATWEKPELPDSADSAALETWLRLHPKSFWGLQRLAERLVHEEKWPEAEKTLKEMQALYPEYVGATSAYELLATVYRNLADPAKERAALEEWTARDVDAIPAFLRLMELGEAAGDWPAVARSARRLLAVNPLIPAPHRGLARAAEKLGERDDALASYRALLLLGDLDAANIHFRLALLLRQGGELDQAKREVLKALEEAPRFLEAHKLLLELIESGPKLTPTPEIKR